MSFSRPPTSSPLPASPPSSIFLDMKDVSNTTAKPARLSIYPKKRPSPVRDGGVAKARKTPAVAVLPTALRRSPVAPELQRIREAQLMSQARDTRLLEEEYRFDILRYMHDMEVSPATRFFLAVAR